jgi:hypothetical protein
MSTFKRQLQIIVREYQQAGEVWPASTMKMAEWAINNGKFNLRSQTVQRICARELAQVMREEVFTDPKGRRVRAKHPAKITEGGEQKTLWDDIRTAPRRHMESSFQWHRKRIVGECKQVKTDVDSYNETHPEEKPIQMVLDFTKDVAELEALQRSDEWNELEDAEELDEFEDIEELDEVEA